jgi:hypothetical protein
LALSGKLRRRRDPGGKTSSQIWTEARGLSARTTWLQRAARGRAAFDRTILGYMFIARQKA